MPKAKVDCTTPAAVQAISEPVAAVVAQGRPAIEAAIDTLISTLDSQDGDTEKEGDTSDLEPSLAGTENDIEHDDSDYEEDHDNEPETELFVPDAELFGPAARRAQLRDEKRQLATGGAAR